LAVLFDLDDTLTYTYSAKSQIHIATARKHFGIELVPEEILRHWGKPNDELFQALYKTYDMRAVYDAIQVETPNFPMELIGDVNGVLGRLRRAQLLTGLVTSATQGIIKRNIEVGDPFPDVRLFHYIQTAEDTEFHKPDPRVFNPAKIFLGRKSVALAQTLYVGDGLLDAQAASGAGLQFVGVGTGPKMTVKDFESEGFDAIDSVEGLPEYLGLPC